MGWIAAAILYVLGMVLMDYMLTFSGLPCRTRSAAHRVQRAGQRRPDGMTAQAGRTVSWEYVCGELCDKASTRVYRRGPVGRVDRHRLRGLDDWQRVSSKYFVWAHDDSGPEFDTVAEAMAAVGTPTPRRRPRKTAR